MSQDPTHVTRVEDGILERMVLILDVSLFVFVGGINTTDFCYVWDFSGTFDGG